MREASVQCRLPGEMVPGHGLVRSVVGDRPPSRPLSVRHVSDHYTTSSLALETDVACSSATYTSIILAHAFLIGPSKEKPECNLHEEGDATQGTRQTLDENGSSSRNDRTVRSHHPIAQSKHTVPPYLPSTIGRGQHTTGGTTSKAMRRGLGQKATG
jgi:hypothetical protein